VKRALALLVLLAVVAAGTAAVYQAAARQRDYRNAVTRGDNALRDDQTFAAIEAYSGAIELRPESMLAYLRRGQTYKRRGDRGDLDAAARDFRTAATLDPTATRPLEELGDVNYQLQLYARAVEAYEHNLKLDDRSARVAQKLALARYRSGDVDGALASVSQALRLDDKNADAHYVYGLCLRAKSRIPEATAAFERVITLSPAMIPARDELADLYAVQGRRGDELEQLQALQGLDRARVERAIAVAMAHAGAGHWDLAVLTLGGALEQHPDNPLIYRALGQVWLERPRDDRAFLSKAREALERATASPNATSDVFALYGRALIQEGDTIDAEDALQQATTRFPVEPSAFLLYASVAEKQNHVDAARDALVRYGALVSSDADFASRAGRIAALSLRLNDAPTAVTWLTQAAAANPSDLRLLAALADAQVRSGNRAGAQSTVERGLEKDPKNAALLSLKQRNRL
jgi:tetratricopeptide (TPR) repeat protein